jgi:hypothetical protein
MDVDFAFSLGQVVLRRRQTPPAPLIDEDTNRRVLIVERRYREVYTGQAWNEYAAKHLNEDGSICQHEQTFRESELEPETS